MNPVASTNLGDSSNNAAHLSSTASASSVPKSQDPGWKYGIRVPNTKQQIRCLFCGLEPNGGITRFKQHLAGITRNVAPCKKITPIAKAEIKAFLEKVDAKKVEKGKKREELLKSVSIFPDDDRDPVLIPMMKKRIAGEPRKGQEERKLGGLGIIFSQQVKWPKANKMSIESRFRSKDACDHAAQYISRRFYQAGIPFNTVSLDSFKRMIETIGLHGSGMEPPSPYEIKGPMLDKEVALINEKLSDVKKSWGKFGVTIMTDVWTDRRSIMNILVNCLLGTIFLRSYDCSASPHTTEFICNWVEEAILEVGAENGIQVVTDNASANLAAQNELKRKISHIMWTPCAAHCLNLMLENIGKLTKVKKAVSQARVIGIFIYCHHKGLSMMRSHLKGELVRPGVTRFATAYLCLFRLMHENLALVKMFNCQEWASSKWSKERDGMKIASIVASTGFWNAVKFALRVFSPLVRVPRLVETEVNPPMSFLYNAMEVAKWKIIKNFRKVERDFKPVIDIIEERWVRQMRSPLYLVAYYLNPRFYYNSPEMLDDGTILDAVTTYVSTMISSPDDQLKVIKAQSLYQNSLGSFGSDMAKRQRNTLSPAEWWSQYGTGTPKLRSFAIRILSLTCSASGCERNCSAFEGLHSVKRNRLDQQHLNDLVFVRYNWKLLDRHAKFQSGKEFDALILDDFDACTADDWLREDDVGDMKIFPGEGLTLGMVEEVTESIHETRVSSRIATRGRASGSSSVTATTGNRGRGGRSRGGEDEAAAPSFRRVVMETLHEDFEDMETDDPNIGNLETVVPSAAEVCEDEEEDKEEDMNPMDMMGGFEPYEQGVRLQPFDLGKDSDGDDDDD